MLVLASRKAAMASSHPGLPVIGEEVPAGVVAVADAELAADEVAVLAQAVAPSSSAQVVKTPAA
jgi:hypothetical protein